MPQGCCSSQIFFMDTLILVQKLSWGDLPMSEPPKPGEQPEGQDTAHTDLFLSTLKNQEKQNALSFLQKVNSPSPPETTILIPL